MDLESKIFKMKVIGKREGIKGLIFKSPEYLVALQVVDMATTKISTMEYEVPFHQYSALKVGDKINVRMYTPNGHTWFYSRELAELFRE